MTYRGQSVRSKGARSGAPILLSAVVLAGCSSGIVDSTPTTSGGSGFRQRMASLFGSSESAQAAQAAQPMGNEADPNWDCPTVDIRTGASTMQVNPGREPTAATLRYQASISRVARECTVAGPSMTIKVGVQGRIIMGQSGTPGQMDIPLRYALVREGPEPRTILTKLHRFPVNVAEANTPFLHVEEDITFTIPRRADLENYIVYVGFDPTAVREAPAKKRPSR
jgi:hypothetical protein